MKGGNRSGEVNLGSPELTILVDHRETSDEEDEGTQQPQVV